MFVHGFPERAANAAAPFVQVLDLAAYSLMGSAVNASVPESERHRPMLGLACRLGAMATLGIMFALVKIAGNHGIHVVESLFWRQAAGLPVVLIWLWSMGGLRSIRTNRPMMHGVRMLLGLSGMTLNFSAMLILPMAEATTIGFATPIFATVLAALLLREPTGRYRWGAVLIGFVGVMLAIRPGSTELPLIGTGIALGGAMLSACVIIQMRQMAHTESPGAIVFWFSLASLVPLGIGMIYFAHGHDLNDWLLLAGLSLTGAMGQIFLTASLRYAPVAAVMTMDYSALLWSIGLGWLFFGDVPGASVWLGAPLIIVAGVFIAWREQYLAKQRRIKVVEYPAG
jgi:drug/metabolite transporter (DMT)-like permease